jgi:CRISPR/Cas system-associated endonuclease Cas1
VAKQISYEKPWESDIEEERWEVTSALVDAVADNDQPMVFLDEAGLPVVAVLPYAYFEELQKKSYAWLGEYALQNGLVDDQAK